MIDICKPGVTKERYCEVKRSRLERSVASSSLHSSLDSENLDDAIMEIPEFDLEDGVKENIMLSVIHQKPAPKYTKWDPDMSAIPTIPGDGAPSRLLEGCGEEPVSLALCGRGFCDDDFLVEARAAFTTTDSSMSSQHTDSSMSSQNTDSFTRASSDNLDLTGAARDSFDITGASHNSLDLSRASSLNLDLTRASSHNLDLTTASCDSVDLTSISIMCDQSLHHIAVQQLLQCEAMYVEEMHKAIETYSRPLRYCALSAKDHVKLFQNVEKVHINLI